MRGMRRQGAAALVVVALGAGIALGGCAETSMSGDKMMGDKMTGDKMMDKKDGTMMEKKEGQMMDKKDAGMERKP